MVDPLGLEQNPDAAPEHLVRQLAALLPIHGSPVRSFADAVSARRAQARLVADLIWRSAYVAGSVSAYSVKPVQMFMCNPCPNKAQVLAVLNPPTPKDAAR